MNIKLTAAAAGAMLLSSCTIAPSWSGQVPADFGYVPAPPAVARTGPTLPVGKCINMSNMLAAPREGEWGRPFVDGDFRIIADAGFRTIRLPVRWSAHAAADAPYTIDPAFLARVHRAVDGAKAAGLNVILNVHNYTELTAEPAAHAPRLAGLWRQIGKSFAGEPDSIWFELMNEPFGKLDDTNLQAVLGPALAAVRESNPTRPVLIGGQNWSGLPSLATLALPDDPYVVPTFHYYEPFAFTHQGAAWTAPNTPPLGRRYGTAEDKEMLARDLATVKAYMERTGRVPILGEYGAQDDPRVPVADRILYYGTVSAAFASAGIPSCAWGYASGFRIRDGKRWIPGILQSIAAPVAE